MVAHPFSYKGPPKVASMHATKDVIVIGSGIIGLTTACLLQQRHPATTRIAIVASEFPVPSPMTTDSSDDVRISNASTDYASMWAGAHYRPIPYLPPTHLEYGPLPAKQQRFQSQLANEHHLAVSTAKVMKELAKTNPVAGVAIMPGVEFLESPPIENLVLKSGDVYASQDDAFRVFTTAETEALNKCAQHDKSGQIRWACEYETYVVNVHVYCAWLLQQFLQRGGKTIRKKLCTIDEALRAVPETTEPVIINCSGTNFSNDQEMKMIRGQTVLVRNQYHKTVTRQCADGTWCFLIPRPLGGGTVIGGTKQVCDSETNARPEERQRLLENALRYFPEFVGGMDDFEVIMDNVGRRPWREGGMRIEVGNPVQDRRSVPVVHAYGAGGRGFELSWGVAEKVCNLVENSSLKARL